ncbi:MAG: cardiolipin synthase [Bacilli bacterium]
MKRKLRYKVNNQEIEKYVNYIPLRYILAIFLTIIEVLAILLSIVVLCYIMPYFYLLAFFTQIVCVIRIIASDDNPDYKIPWLFFVMAVPIAGYMLYFLFYSRKLKKKYLRRLQRLKDSSYQKDDQETLKALQDISPQASSQARLICNIGETHLFTNTKQTYFPLGEKMMISLIEDLKNARKFIYMEYFIIEQGVFWDSILKILKEKVKEGVEVKVVYDDIGCMQTLPGLYFKTLKKWGISAVPFSFLKGSADSEFNNRSHRKITVIDGIIGYTGGINLADEYINKARKYGHWKDNAIRIEGEAVKEFTKLFLIDYGLNAKKINIQQTDLFPSQDINCNGFMVPFGDGPKPIYQKCIGKIVIQNMLNMATRYAYMTSPYLIIDNDLCSSIENAALRGVDVRIIVPHIPDKKLVFAMTQSYYHRLMNAGVKIYEYTPGFIHAKSYLVDDKYGLIGTINLDYRSLVHHFENGVWMYDCECLVELKKDIEETLRKSMEVKKSEMKQPLLKRFIQAIVRIFAPLL